MRASLGPRPSTHPQNPPPLSETLHILVSASVVLASSLVVMDDRVRQEFISKNERELEVKKEEVLATRIS